MERWDDLRYLVAVKKAGTMSGAARLLGANVGTVSRRIERLGSDLGVQPFLKTPDGWLPNPALDGLIEAATDFENRITVETNRRLDETSPRSVPMKINCPPLVSSLFLFPGLPKLRQTAPEVQLTVTHSVFNTTLGDNDLIITSSLPDRGRLMARKIGGLHFSLYAPTNHRDPENWAGLFQEYDESAPMSLGFQHLDRPPAIRLENFFFLIEAMEITGMAGPLPDLLAERRGGFVRVAAGPETSRVEMFLCYHETRRGDPAIDALAGWIDDCFSEIRAVD